MMEITGNEIERFAAWSGDHNPLHVDLRFAQSVGYSMPVAHGVLGVIRALGSLPPGSSAPITTLDVEFRGAVLRETPTDVTLTREADCLRAALRQEGRHVLAIRCAADEANWPRSELRWTARLAERIATADAGKRLDIADRSWSELQSGIELVATYATDPPPDAASSSGLLSPLAVRVLGLCSYVQGMELPGLRSLPVSLRMRVFRSQADSNTVWYRARTSTFDAASRLLDITLEVASPEGDLLATADLRCYVRHSLAATEIGILAERLSLGENHLLGKAALVCGASRGLGADLASALALAGCRVYAGYRNSTEAARQLAGRLADKGLAIEFLQGDAGDPAWCESARSMICQRHGRLDLLVLSACAAPAALATSPGSAKPLSEYVEANLRTGYMPLATFLPLLKESRGAIVCISSSSAFAAKPGFAHFAALKRGLEAVVEGATGEAESVYSLIVRPPKLLTSWNDAPGLADDAMPTDGIAVDVVNRLARPWHEGRVEIVESFTAPPRGTATFSADGPTIAVGPVTEEPAPKDAPPQSAAEADKLPADGLLPEQEICASLTELEAEVARMVDCPAREEMEISSGLASVEPTLLDRVHNGAVPIRVKIGPESQRTGWVIRTDNLNALRSEASQTDVSVRTRHDLPFSLTVVKAGPERDFLVQLGWREVAPFETSELVIRPDLVLKGLSGPAALAAGWGLRASTAVRAMLQQPTRFDIRQVDRFDLRHDRLWEAMAREMPCGIVRDSAWLNENYVDRTVREVVRLEAVEEGVVRGVVVLTLHAADDECPYRRGHLVEIVAPLADGRLLKQLVQTAGTAAAERNADALFCLSIGSGLAHALRQSGFRAREPRRFLLVNPGDLPETLRRSVLAPREWFMTTGEADIERALEPIPGVGAADRVDE